MAEERSLDARVPLLAEDPAVWWLVMVRHVTLDKPSSGTRRPSALRLLVVHPPIHGGYSPAAGA